MGMTSSKVQHIQAVLAVSIKLKTPVRGSQHIHITRDILQVIWLFSCTKRPFEFQLLPTEMLSDNNDDKIHNEHKDLKNK